MDSQLIQGKANNNQRFQGEGVNRMPRHKSSLGKQFTDEVISPVKKGHMKLEYATEGSQLNGLDSLNNIN